MKHFGISQWIDFTRGFMPEGEGRAMQEHLANGCGECADLANFTSDLSNICAAMNRHNAPEWVVRSAKAIFPVDAPAQPRRASRIPVQLIYDSFLAPAPAGLRVSWQVGWQTLYRAGDCSLDLRIEPELASGRAAVIGQICDHAAPDHKMENVPVQVKSGRTIVAETRSNRFGEFQLEYDQQSRLHLCVYLDNGSKCFQAPLKKFASDRYAAAERLGLGSGPSKLEQQKK